MSQNRCVCAFVVMGLIGALIGIEVCDHYFLKAVAAQARNPYEGAIPEAISSINVDPAIRREVSRQIANAFADQTRHKGLRLRIRENIHMYTKLAAIGAGSGFILAAGAVKFISSRLPKQC